MTFSRRFLVFLAAAALASALLLLPVRTFGFTQSGAAGTLGNGIPMGHEWVTRQAAIELLLPGHDPQVPADPADPRKDWTQGKAQTLALPDGGEVARIKAQSLQEGEDLTYAAVYKPVRDVILGERWVDIGGFNFSTEFAAASSGRTDCLDAVTQEPPEVQYDHFMRRYDDAGPDGGVNAAKQSQERFVRYFVNAAMAPSSRIRVWDGGGSSVAVSVDLNYFLFGRAVHLFEDSFSSEHTVRTSADNYTTIKEVKSYLCAKGSEAHSHDKAPVFDYSSGDVIWNVGTRFNPGWGGYIPSHLKPTALAAIEGMKDVFAAFIRTMDRPRAQREAKATAEARTLVSHWLSFDETTMKNWYTTESNRDATYILADGQSGAGRTQDACMTSLGRPDVSQADEVAALKAKQRACLHGIQPREGYADFYDNSLHMPFYWGYINTLLEDAPVSWTIPSYDPGHGEIVTIKNLHTNYPMTANVTQDALIWSRKGSNLRFFQVPSLEGKSVFFRSADDPTLFLSYTALTGRAELFKAAELGTQLTIKDSSYNLRESAKKHTLIYSKKHEQYMWVNGAKEVYLSKEGKRHDDTAQWTIQKEKP